MTDAQTETTAKHASSRQDEAADGQVAADRRRTEAADEHRAVERRVVERQALDERSRREEYGGLNLGADFFGWLVAVAMTVLLAAVIGAVAAALNSTIDISRTEAERRAGTFGLVTAIALVAVLMVAYFTGGYVAGRMSRYDGGRQGFGAWLIGLLMTLAAVALGAFFGVQYDVFDRVDLPSMPIPTDTATWGGIVTLAAAIVGTLIAAFIGGKVGQRYHSKVNRVTGPTPSTPR